MSNLQPFQFSMFERAGDLLDPAKTKLGDGDLAKIQKRKLTEAHFGLRSRPVQPGEESLYKSIQREGVKEPVEMVRPGVVDRERPGLMDGHHRVIAAHDINPNSEIPVRW